MVKNAIETTNVAMSKVGHAPHRRSWALRSMKVVRVLYLVVVIVAIVLTFRGWGGVELLAEGTGKGTPTSRSSKQTKAGGVADKDLRRFGDKHTIGCVTFSKDGKLLISGGGDYVRIWDRKTYKQVTKLHAPKAKILRLALSPDGNLVAAGGLGKRLWVWDLSNKKLKRRLDHAGTEVTGLAFSPDGKSIVSGGGDGVVRAWNLKTGKVAEFSGKYSGWVRAVTVSANGDYCASAGVAEPLGSVKLWNLKTRNMLKRFAVKATPWRVAFSPDSKYLAFSFGGYIRIVELERGKILVTCPEQPGYILALKYSPTGDYIVFGTGSSPASLERKDPRAWSFGILDARTGKVVATRRMGMEGFVFDLAVSPDGRWVAGAAGEGFEGLLWRTPRAVWRKPEEKGS